MAIPKKLKIRESTCNNNMLFLDDMLFEVLGRLPPKSLYVCKSVCKGWFSIISRPEFIRLYRNRLEKSRLLLSIRDGKGLFSNQRYLLGTRDSSNLLNIEDWLSVPYTKYYGVTQVINSLVCFYVACRVRLCNLTTGEILDLPFSHYRGSAQNYRYFFGFDPISATYKLLKVNLRDCEILTLGENMREDSWKSVDVPYFPLKSKPEEAFCVDGVLYWLQGYKNRDVISFDLNTHRFGSCFLPELNSSYTIGAALQFRGCLAFAYKCGSHFNIFSQSRDKCNRTTHTFELPTELIQQWNNLIPFGSLPTGEIMLVEADRETTIYSYDPENQKFERFLVPQLKSNIDSARISSFEANFSPLRLILKQN